MSRPAERISAGEMEREARRKSQKKRKEKNACVFVMEYYIE